MLYTGVLRFGVAVLMVAEAVSLSSPRQVERTWAAWQPLLKKRRN